MKKKILQIVGIIFAAGMIGGIGYAIGYYSPNPNHITTGYGYGNEDGYSIGYLDGKIGADPKPNRRMLKEDYDFRILLGGRAVGDP